MSRSLAVLCCFAVAASSHSLIWSQVTHDVTAAEVGGPETRVTGFDDPDVYVENASQQGIVATHVIHSFSDSTLSSSVEASSGRNTWRVSQYGFSRKVFFFELHDEVQFEAVGEVTNGGILNALIVRKESQEVVWRLPELPGSQRDVFTLERGIYGLVHEGGASFPEGWGTRHARSTITLEFNSVPEPSGILALLGSALWLFGARRKR